MRCPCEKGHNYSFLEIGTFHVERQKKYDEMLDYLRQRKEDLQNHNPMPSPAIDAINEEIERIGRVGFRDIQVCSLMFSSRSLPKPKLKPMRKSKPKLKPKLKPNPSPKIIFSLEVIESANTYISTFITFIMTFGVDLRQ